MLRERFSQQINRLLIVLKQKQALLFGVMLVLLVVGITSGTKAADFQERRIFVESSIASEVTRHNFEMRSVTASPVGSIAFEYCTNNPFIGTACTAPPGLDVSSASLDGQSGMIGFTINGTATTSNRLVIERTPSITAPTDLTYVFSNITNPSAAEQTVYVRVTSHGTTDATGPNVDAGAVVFSTATGIGVGGYVPPYLTFCVGLTVNFGCAGGGQGFLGTLGEFSSSSASTTTTQMGAATNDPTGYNIFMNGQTLTSGNNIINPLPSGTASSPGTTQFGVNLVNNSSPNVGANVSGPGVGSAAANYDDSNRFRFVDGDRVAFATLPVAFNFYTVSYIVNISQDQPPGVYSSTITYTAIASF